MTGAANGARSNAVIRRPVLLVILDGFGFNPETEARVLDAAATRLGHEVTEQILALTAPSQRASVPLPPRSLLELVIAPVLLTVATLPAYRGVAWPELQAAHQAARDAMATAEYKGRTLLALADAAIRAEAERACYSLWLAQSPTINAMRNCYPTVVTQASGLAAGYEDVTPRVQGNSETGHQQLSNFIVAAQTPLEISSDIADGSFFRNPMLVKALAEVKRRGSHLDIFFLLSGEYGNDGRVHSAWNHLEATLEAAFNRAGLHPEQVRIEAILDGRDSPPRSSIEEDGGRYGFLYKLKQLLQRYNATQSLAWIIGRSLAMDRDYEERRVREDFELTVHGRGTPVVDIDAAIAAVRALHEQGYRDTNVPPIVIGDPPRCIEDGDVALDLNFRADRQREKVACLLGARAFLQRGATAKGRAWTLDWLQPPRDLAVYCMSEYHPELEQKYGAHILYPIKPQAHNLFAILAEQSRAQGFPFRYLLTAESTKALHVGYFIRGRREQPSVPGVEERRIIPSYGTEFGVDTDDDYYKTPQMRAFAIADFVVESLAQKRFDLIAANFSNTDMIGHLMPKRFEAAVRSIELIDTTLATIVPAALRFDFDVIITADHGNVEDDGSSHTVNDILTTFISPNDELRLCGDPRQPARLFDIPWCIVEIMGIAGRILPRLPTTPAVIEKQGLVGRSRITVAEPFADSRAQTHALEMGAASDGTD